MIVGLLALFVVACTDGGGDAAAQRARAGTGGAPAPVPAAHTLSAGTTVDATIQSSVSSRSDTRGTRVNAIVTRNVMDGGQIVIPGGASIALRVAQLEPARHPGDTDGVIAFDVTALTVGGVPYTPTATVGPVPHTLRGRGPGGTITAAQTERDVVVTPGTPITITLTQLLKLSAI